MFDNESLTLVIKFQKDTLNIAAIYHIFEDILENNYLRLSADTL